MLSLVSDSPNSRHVSEHYVLNERWIVETRVEHIQKWSSRKPNFKKENKNSEI